MPGRKPAHHVFGGRRSCQRNGSGPIGVSQGCSNQNLKNVEFVSEDCVLVSLRREATLLLFLWIMLRVRLSVCHEKLSRKRKCMYIKRFLYFRGKLIWRFGGHSDVSEARRDMNPTQKNTFFPMETLPAPETAGSCLRCPERRFKIYKKCYLVDLEVRMRFAFVPSF